jgi:hypothetical protein
MTGWRRLPQGGIPQKKRQRFSAGVEAEGCSGRKVSLVRRNKNAHFDRNAQPNLLHTSYAKVGHLIEAVRITVFSTSRCTAIYSIAVTNMHAGIHEDALRIKTTIAQAPA